MNGHADVIWLSFKQIQQYSSESIIDESGQVWKVDEGQFLRLIVKTSFALFLMCISESHDDSSTLNEVPSFRFDFGDGLYR